MCLYDYTYFNQLLTQLSTVVKKATATKHNELHQRANTHTIVTHTQTHDLTVSKL